MRILLPQLGDPAWSVVPAVSKALRSQRGAPHEEVDDPDAADVILFTECHQLGEQARARVLGHPLLRHHRGRCAVYDERDFTWCWLPGVYVGMPQGSFVPRWQVAGSYWALQPLAVPGPGGPAPDLLASFVGGPTHPCREAIFALADPALHIERAAPLALHSAPSGDFDRRRHHFAEVVARSKFVLCPRGHGTSSFRLFETMSAGRVPVIISDDWVAPAGPDWSRVAVRVPERDVAGLPELLRRLEPGWAAMAAGARRAYDEWFAPDVAMAIQLDVLGSLLRAPGRAFPPAGVRNLQYGRVAARRAKVAVMRRSAGLRARGRRG